MTSDQIPNSYSLSQIYQEEENDYNVYAIREEIIERAMNEIDIICTQQRLIQFVVDCAQSAMRKMITLYFYHHNNSPNVECEWSCDKPNPPSKPDTWVTKKVPIRKRVPETSETLLLSQTLESTCSCGIDKSCYCFDPQLMVEDYLKDKSLESMEHPSITGSLLKSGTSILSETIKHIEDRQKLSDTEQDDTEWDSKTSSTEKILNESLYRLHFLKKKICILKPSSQAPSKLNYNVHSKGVRLPPIRVESKFDATSPCEEEKVLPAK